MGHLPKNREKGLDLLSSNSDASIVPSLNEQDVLQVEKCVYCGWFYVNWDIPIIPH